MARPIEFEYEDVLDRALQLFWSNGFKRTSMKTLVNKLRINRASVYNTFGSKEELFRIALDRYAQTQLPSLLEPLREPNKSSPAQLYSFFCAMIKLGGKDNAFRGCFVINSLNELANVEPELSVFCLNTLGALKGELQRVVSRGQQLGELRADVDSKVLTTHFLSMASGLLAMAKAKTPTSHLKEAAKAGLRMIVAKKEI
jgi:TetR/AcrR family transcriptional repressor of nem operon